MNIKNQIKEDPLLSRINRITATPSGKFFVYAGTTVLVIGAIGLLFQLLKFTVGNIKDFHYTMME